MHRLDSQKQSDPLLWFVPTFGAGALAWVACSPLSPGHSIGDWLGMAVIFLPLTVGGALVSSAFRRGDLVLRVAGALLGGAVLLVFLRAQTDWVHLGSQTWRALSIFALLAAGLVLLPLPTTRSLRRDSLGALGSFALLLGALGFVALAPTDLRWHLYGHQRFLGAIAGHLTDRLPVPLPQQALADSKLRRDSQRNHDLTSEREFSPDQPSVVLIMIDTLRADAFSFYGGVDDSMPETEAFARRSAVIRDMWTNSTWTRPSVASFFTGRLPEHLGMLDEDDRLADEVETLAERFHAQGHETIAFMTNPHVGEKWGFAQGFEQFHELKGRDGYARAASVRRRVDQWLSNRQGDRPMFLYIHFMDPHTPYLSGNAPRIGQMNREAYRSELRYLDRHLAELLQLLERKLGEDIVIALTSDHGEEFGEHGRFGHGQSVYPELTRIPLIVKLPGHGRGVVNARLEARDVFGLLSQAGRAGWELQAWAEETDDGIRSVSSYKTPGSRLVRLWRPYDVIRVRGLQHGQSFVVWNAFGPTEELYDLSEDPSAHRNRAAPPREGASLATQIDDAVGYWSEPEEGTFTAEERRELRALGYLQ